MPAAPTTRPSCSSTQNDSRNSAIAIGGSHSAASRRSISGTSSGRAKRRVMPMLHRAQGADALFDRRVGREKVVQEALMSLQWVADVEVRRRFVRDFEW